MQITVLLWRGADGEHRKEAKITVENKGLVPNQTASTVEISEPPLGLHDKGNGEVKKSESLRKEKYHRKIP